MTRTNHITSARYHNWTAGVWPIFKKASRCRLKIQSFHLTGTEARSIFNHPGSRMSAVYINKLVFPTLGSALSFGIPLDFLIHNHLDWYVWCKSHNWFFYRLLETDRLPRVFHRKLPSRTQATHFAIRCIHSAFSAFAAVVENFSEICSRIRGKWYFEWTIYFVERSRRRLLLYGFWFPIFVVTFPNSFVLVEEQR